MLIAGPIERLDELPPFDEQNPTADLTALTPAVNRLLLQSEMRGALRIETELLSRALADRRPVSPAP